MFLVKVAEFFGLFSKAQKWLKGKKTYISAVGGMCASSSTMLILFLSWIDAEISANDFLDQVKVPAGVFWVSATFLFAAIHPKNVREKLGPGH